MFTYVSVGSVGFDFVDELKALYFFMSGVFTCRELETRRRNSGRKYAHLGLVLEKFV
jgi:hypothetical protein